MYGLYLTGRDVTGGTVVLATNLESKMAVDFECLSCGVVWPCGESMPLSEEKALVKRLVHGC